MSAFPYIISMAIFVFGMWLMSIADQVAGFEALVFFGGILCVAAAMAVPIQLLGHRESGV
ncbi:MULTISPECIES: hypothetical protein [Agromyces]|uniref:Uncharacterized protein n=1 Tax=Agromyces indicus TaxID=758919 RepID=A0ABU1FKQ7_9MICO|nr:MULTISPECIES: hypothetical protein [Agromyces]KZE95128.1 hypothetical protein AVP42_00519 [Agromyces sp. NDB4Y10]MCK8609979.1 hypothetical protein [Agromyces sp. C10]MDR5692349.1 hypothetical protein [Agromyces indicus]